MKKCPRCGSENPDDVHLCSNCRYPLPAISNSQVCTRCGHLNPNGAAICEVCHYPLRLSFFVPPVEKEDLTPALSKLERGALSLAISVLTFSLATFSINSVIGSITLLASVVLLSAASSYYSIGFRFLGKRYKTPAILSSFLLPGFLLLAVGISEITNPAPQAILASLSRNPLAVILIDSGFLLFVLGGVGISLGVYRLRIILGSSNLRLASVISLVGIIASLFFPQLAFLAVAGQLIIFSEMRKRRESHFNSHP